MTEQDNLFHGLDSEFIEAIKNELLPPDPVFSAEELKNFGHWVTATGMQPEGARAFDLDKYPYQKELYDEQRDCFRSRVVIMKAAQTGLTIKLLNRAMWLTADVKQQINVGLGFPTRDAVEQLAASRFKPQLYSSARMIELLRNAGDRKLAKDTVSLVRLGVSNMRFLGLMSGVTADSNPLDAELVDEVRLVPSTTIERFMVRVSESTIIDKSARASNGARGIIELNSTAGFPQQDIHRYFLDSTQGYWLTHCPDKKCSRHRAGISLAREFAENHSRVVGRHGNGRYYLRCPVCGAHIDDEAILHGHYHHEQPDALWVGYHFSQLIKGEDFLNTEIMPAWERGINVPEFFNSRLGLPYMDSEAVPATREVVEMCCDDSLTWLREPPGKDGKWRAMGIDQRAPEKHIVIKSLDESGNEVLEHVEVLEASGQAAVAGIVSRAREWGCSIVIIDGEPSYDLAVDVARGLPRGVVWLSDYVDQQPNILKWEDKRSDKTIRRSSGETKHEYRVLVDRYKGLDWSLGLYRRQKIRLPRRVDLYELRQQRMLGGVAQMASVANEFVDHLGNLARYKAPKKVSIGKGEYIHVPGEYVLRWRYLHLDPHFAHANLSASVGLARRSQTDRITLLTEPTPVIGKNEESLPPNLRAQEIKNQLEQRKTCGSCRHRLRDQSALTCNHLSTEGRRVIISPEDIGCMFHSPEPDSVP